MSKSNIIPPPFTNEDDKMVITTTPNQATPKGLMTDARKRPLVTSNQKDHSKKNQKDSAPLLLPPPTIATQTFARLATTNVSDVELNSWSQSGFEENNSAITKGFCELFYRHVSHHEELKRLVVAKDKSDRKMVMWKFKADRAAQDNKKLMESHKEEIETQIGQLRTELREANKKFSDLEKARAEEVMELQARISVLEDEASKFAAEREQSEKDALVLGQVKFMKSFMRKVPNFDWGLLGAATKAYAEQLAVEMEEEALKKEEEAP